MLKIKKMSLEYEYEFAFKKDMKDLSSFFLCLDVHSTDVMNWQLPCGAHPLAPFDHQVAGQSSMLRYDETTLCKPLINREHFVYQTLPAGLKEFTAEFRGEIEVHLAEKDGFQLLYGVGVNKASSEIPCPCDCSWKEVHSHFHNSAKDQSKERNEESMYTDIFSLKSILQAQDQCLMKVLESENRKVYPHAEEIAQGDVTVQHPNALNPWGLKNHKRLLEKMRKSQYSQNCIRFMLLRNVVADFRYPCILDLKIGSRLHGDEADLVKVQSQSRKCRETTSCTIGVRLCGMQVYQKTTCTYTSCDKFHGRTLKEDTFKKALISFIHNGHRSRTELLQPIVSKLAKLIQCLENISSYRFYASSLLIIYDGEETVRLSSNPDTCVTGTKAQRKNGLNSSLQAVEQKSTAVSSKESLHSDKGYATFPAWDETSNDSCIGDSIYSRSQGSVHLDSGNSEETSLSQIQDDTQDELHNKQSSFPEALSISSSEHNHHQCESSCDKLDSQDLNLWTQKSLCEPLFGDSSNAGLPEEYIQKKDESTHNYPVDDATSSFTSSGKVDVKMIDFAHTTHEGFPKDKFRHKGPDLDYIQGLKNLKRLFEEILTVS